MKKGWIRFIDEMPEIGQEIVVAFSCAPFNGASFFGLAKFTDVDKIIIDSKKYPTPIYNSYTFDTDEAYQKYASYAHHWSYKSDENRLNIKPVCEYARMMRGEQYPVLMQK